MKGLKSIVTVLFILILLFLIFLLIVQKKHTHESFTNGEPWPSELVQNFQTYQLTLEPHLRFDMNLVQTQATPTEAYEYVKTGSWSWSSAIEQIYIKAISQNAILSVDVGTSLQSAKKIYNESAIKELLSWNTKEGSFLIGGATIGHSRSMPKNVNNQVRCSPDGKIQKIIYTGYDGINGSRVARVSDVSEYSNIPKLVDGFKFVNEPCDPCVALNNDYTCPFVLNTGNGNSMSSIWKMIWGLPSGDYESKMDINYVADIPPLPTGDNSHKYTTNYV